MLRPRLDKPWTDLTEKAATALPGQLGVYEIADAAGVTVRIGEAGALKPFGLRTALSEELKRLGPGHRFRVEVNMQYRTRCAELLMAHRAAHGALPRDDAHQARRLGVLSPAGR